MTKKTKSKQRLDKFYHLAKDQGYRSRAAFKLIQLNKKYNVLQKAQVVLDLCAAPGGWMQVVSKNASPQCVIIGVDLVPIKSIPNCKSIQADITTKDCFDKIKQQIRHLKADVILNDGAPNVGANWNKDAYNQVELVLLSMKLVTQFLKKNGTYITKVFRCADYQNLIWVMNQFFNVVEANKPLASWDVSAEIFLVCQGYKAPDKIDKKFFDPNFVFNENEKDLQDKKDKEGLVSIQKMFEKWKREIIDEDTPLTMNRKQTMEEYINSENPYIFLKRTNKIIIEQNEFWQLIKENVKVPKDIEDLINDIKQLGKGDIIKLIKFWQIVISKLKLKEDQQQEKNKEIVESVQNDKEDWDQIKKDKKIKKQQDKQILKYVKQKVLNDNKEQAIDNDLDDQEVFNFEDFQQYQEMQQNVDKEQKSYLYQEEKEKQKKTITLELSNTDKQQYYQDLNDNLEQIYQEEKQQKKEEQGKVDIEEEEINFDNNVQEINDQQIDDQVDFNVEKLKQESRWFSQETFGILKNKEQCKTIPLQTTDKNIQKEKKKKRSEFEEDKLAHQELNKLSKQNNKKYKDLDEDEIAEIVAIGKKMLRKKDRQDIIDASYNRYNYEDDEKDLPEWFVQDEKKHIGKIPIVTKEDVKREKEQLRVIQQRLPKKVLEAKMRKKKWFTNMLKKTHTQVNSLLEQDNNNPISKAWQINELYKKATWSKKEQSKKLIVSKKGSSAAPNKKSGWKFKVVDKRLKKDLWKQKNNKKKFKIKKSNKNSKRKF